MFWRNTQDRLDTRRRNLAGLLDDIHVTIVVIDDRVPEGEQRPYQDRLRELVASEGNRWEPLGSHDEKPYPKD